MTIDMDAGAFDYVWLWLHAKVREASRPEHAAMYPKHLEVVTRAYNAFAASVKVLNDEVAEIEARTKAPARRVVKRASQAKKATKRKRG